MITNPNTSQAPGVHRSAYTGRLTPRLALQLAAPHTWPAAILPVLMSTAAASTVVDALSVSLVMALLAICILMQAAVNTFNDYYDYVKGSDSASDDVDPTDATLVYNDVNPKSALALAIGFLVAAFVIGIYVIVRAGWIPLCIGIVGALVTVAYSAGKTPVSYLPIGEIVSGVVMGGLIPLACYQALTGYLDAIVLVWALPEIIGIGLIMMTNNTCDIEKDIEAGRSTLPVRLGREKARMLYHALLIILAVGSIANIGVFFTKGLIVVPFAALASYPLVKALMSNPLAPHTRQGAMGQICSVNVALGAFYAAALLASGVPGTLGI